MNGLSNHEKSIEYMRMAQAESDQTMRAEMIEAAARYRNIDLSAAKSEVKRANPAHGVRSLLGFFALVALVLIAAILILAQMFSAKLVLGLFGIVVVLLYIASAFALRVTGHVSEDFVVQAFQSSLKSIPGLKTLFGNTGTGQPGDINSVHAQEGLPAPKVTFDPASNKEQQQ